MIVYQEAWATVGYEPGVPCVEVRWHSYATSEQFRSALQAAVAEFRSRVSEHASLHWLADNRKLAQVAEPDLRWANDVTARELRAAGLRYMGFVVPEAALSDADRSVSRGSGGGGITMRRFASIETAHAWLATCGAAEAPPARG
jgi:hypothetical protein